jgi:hypothetical protein
MPNRTSLLWNRPIALVLTAVGLLLPALRAAEADITAVTATGGLYVIDSDAANGAAGYDRDAIPVSVTVGLTGTAFTEPVRDFRVGFRMFDSDGAEIALVGSSQYSNVISWPTSFGAANPFGGGGQPLPSSVVFTGRPKPAVRLDSNKTYRIQAQVQRWTTSPLFSGYFNLGDPVQSSLRRYFHFTNTVSNDAARNVIARMASSPSFARRFAITSSPNQKGFLINAPYQLRRYDNYASGTSTDATPVQVVWTVQLFREAGTTDVEVPLLADPSFETAVAVPFYEAGSVPREPVLVSGSASLLLRPVSQLDSRETYYARVTIAHRELAAPAPPVVSNFISTSAQRLLHFNGRLDFGLVQTTIEEISGEPATGATLEAGTPAPSVLCSPQIVTGRLAAPNNGHTYGDGSALAVRLLPDGRAVYNNPAVTVPVTAPTSPDKDRENGIAFFRSGTTLSTAGASAALAVLVPAGMTVTGSANGKLGIPFLPVGVHSLSASLRPLSAQLVYAPPNPLHVAEETKPVQIEVSQFTWVRADGRIDLATTGTAAYIQAAEMAWLKDAPVPEAQQIKRSNERYYAGVTGLISPGATITTSGANLGAHLSAGFTFGIIDFRAHFPYDARVVASGGQVTIREDAISPVAADSRLDGVTSISPTYQQACVQQGCAGVVPRFGTFRLKPDNQRLLFTGDGGLVAAGDFDTIYQVSDRTNRLEWGFISESGGVPRFAHAHLRRFTRGAFHATGHFLRAAASSAPLEERPGIVHNTGFHAANPAATPERPGSAAYAAGNADYAGINLRAGGESQAITARSIVANTQTPVYSLKARSKYYVRRSGNAGIHDAAESPGNFVLYGFPVSFANFSFGFRETQNVSSATLGQIVVPYPSDFVQPFEELILSCLGDLQEAKIPEDGEPQTLDYWAAEFEPFSFEIQKEDGCSPGGNAVLAMIIRTQAHHLPAPLEGKVGWYSDGTIVPRSDPNYSVTSRFTLPASLSVAGPGSENYPATPASEAYFNSYKELPSPDPIGFLSFAARVAVPYFEDLQVHLHTFAKPVNPPAGALPSRLHLMGGWTEAGKTFFSSSLFDSDHRGYPVPLNLATYRNEGADRLPAPGPEPSLDPFSQYRVYARRGFLNEEKFFEYPIEFLSGPRVWTSSAPQTDPILVFEVAHQLDRMSPQHADITFGVSHDGLPALSLANSAFSFVDEAVAGTPAAGGFRNIVAGVLGNPRMDQLTGGLASLGQVTGDRFDLFADHFIVNAVNPRLKEAYDELKTAYNGPDPWPAVAGPLLDTFKTNIDLRLHSDTLSDQPALISGANLTLLNATRAKLWTALDQAVKAMDVLATTEGGQGLFIATNNYSVTRQLVKNLVQQGSPEAGAIVAQLAGPLLDAKIADLVERGAPTLGDVRAALEEVQGRLETLRDQVNESGEFSQALRKVIQDGTADAAFVALQARNEMQAIVNSEPNKYFNQLPRSAFEDRVRNRLRARLMSRPMTAQLLGVMRQYLYDLDAQSRTRIDSGFQVANRIVRNVLAESIEDVNPAYANALGGLASCLGAADIDGYARLNGDTLRTLRLDMKARVDLMSEMKADFYLQIDCLQSEGDEACSWGAAGEYYTEVRMGADNVEAEWLGDMRLNVGLKCTLDDNGGLLGMGGSIELAGGKAKFEKFALTEFGATAMFGTQENYVGAKARAEFNKKALKVGFFFGRTCDKAPLKLVDPDVASILGDPPFTGGYVYGEMSYPLNEILGIPSTCFLSLTGTVGAGIWVFTEGPEFGGKMYLKIVGEVICIAEIGGEITLLGGKSGNDFVLKGKGRLWVEVCFLFCFEGEAGVRVKCRNSDCDFDVDV